MRRLWLVLVLVQGAGAAQVGCQGISPRACLGLAMDAMGGEARLRSIKSVRLDVVSHTALVEQSYRQAPFITSYERDRVVMDFVGGRTSSVQHGIWPEADPQEAESDVTVITTPKGVAYKTDKAVAPGGRSALDAAEESLALGPERLLLTAAAASDLHFESDEVLRSTPHSVLAFHWGKVPVRILVGRFTHLPDAVETVEQFGDFWFYWGDVRQTVYWDNWKVAHGVVYPTNQITERNGEQWASSQALDTVFNEAVDEKTFAVDTDVLSKSLTFKGWEKDFDGGNASELAPGITLFAGSWNATVVEQGDGVVILETPISGTFTEGLFAEARKRYPGKPVKAVLSTSDSWPHVGGVRFDVSEKVPVYLLDLNCELLEKMVAAPHTLHPDALQKRREAADFRAVEGKTEIGAGANRMVLYPLRGASTERQYMVYFPEHRLLYASDTVVMQGEEKLYAPELAREVQLAVEREGLAVDTVFAMHQGPVAWSKVTALVGKSMEN